MKYVVCGVVCVGAVAGTAVVVLFMLGIYAAYSASVFINSDHI
jgi:hypothetical protein